MYIIKQKTPTKGRDSVRVKQQVHGTPVRAPTILCNFALDKHIFANYHLRMTLNSEFAIAPEMLPPSLLPAIGRDQEEYLPVAPWPPQFTFELALGIDDLDTLLERFNITLLEYEILQTAPGFRQELHNHQQEIKKNGLTFTHKARVQAEAYLEEVHEIVTDSDVSASTRLDAIKSVVRWAGLEPKESSGSQNNPANAFQININLM